MGDMSIIAMTRQVETAALRRAPDTKRAAADSTAPGDYVEKVVQWIPSEAVGAYIAVWGVLTPSTDPSRWAVFVVGLLSVGLLILLGTALAQKRRVEQWQKEKKPGAPPRTSQRDRLLLLTFASVAFTTWVAALTDSPFATIDSNASKVGGAVLVGLALFAPKVAELLDLAPGK
jgi:hypothetical protein